MGTLNRGQIIDQALQRVGNNSNSLKFQARITLQRLLNDLYQGWDWPFLTTTGPLTIPPNGAFQLPADFVRPEDDHSLRVTSPSSYPLQEVDHQTYADVQTPSASTTALPRLWTIDYAAKTHRDPDTFELVRVGPTGLVWPRPSEGLSAELRYKFLPPPIPFVVGATTDFDNDIPHFPWDTFLIDTLTEWAMSYEADPRRAEQVTINEAMLQRLRGATYPERSFPTTVPLDPMFFSTPSWGSGRE